MPVSVQGCVSCFGCCRLMEEPRSCARCGVPVCGAACAESPLRLHALECKVMQSRGWRYFQREYGVRSTEY